MFKRILVLDESRDTLNFIREALNYEKFEVKITSGSSDIIECIQNYCPDLVILDYKDNRVKRETICRQIKADPRFFNLPVIICSAYLNSNSNTETLAWGCDAVIAKPFGFSELMEKVNNLIAV